MSFKKWQVLDVTQQSSVGGNWKSYECVYLRERSKEEEMNDKDNFGQDVKMVLYIKGQYKNQHDYVHKKYIKARTEAGPREIKIKGRVYFTGVTRNHGNSTYKKQSSTQKKSSSKSSSNSSSSRNALKRGLDSAEPLNVNSAQPEPGTSLPSKKKIKKKGGGQSSTKKKSSSNSSLNSSSSSRNALKRDLDSIDEDSNLDSAQLVPGAILPSKQQKIKKKGGFSGRNAPSAYQFHNNIVINGLPSTSSAGNNSLSGTNSDAACKITVVPPMQSKTHEKKTVITSLVPENDVIKAAAITNGSGSSSVSSSDKDLNVTYEGRFYDTHDSNGTNGASNNIKSLSTTKNVSSVSSVSNDVNDSNGDTNSSGSNDTNTIGAITKQYELIIKKQVQEIVRLNTVNEHIERDTRESNECIQKLEGVRSKLEQQLEDLRSKLDQRAVEQDDLVNQQATTISQLREKLQKWQQDIAQERKNVKQERQNMLKFKSVVLGLASQNLVKTQQAISSYNSFNGPNGLLSTSSLSSNKALKSETSQSL